MKAPTDLFRAFAMDRSKLPSAVSAMAINNSHKSGIKLYLILSVFLCPFPFNNFVYAFFLAFGTLITAFSQMPFNASLPTFLSFVVFTVIWLNLEQPANTFSPILVTFKVYPLILTVDGTTAEAIACPADAFIINICCRTCKFSFCKHI